MGLFDIFKKNKKNRGEKYKLGMHKTRENSFGSIKKILEARSKIDDELFDELEGKIPFATKRPEVWGVNDLAASSVIYRVAVETEPAKHFVTERFLRKEIKKAFDKSHIKIPYTQVEVHNGK